MGVGVVWVGFVVSVGLGVWSGWGDEVGSWVGLFVGGVVGVGDCGGVVGMDVGEGEMVDIGVPVGEGDEVGEEVGVDVEDGTGVGAEVGAGVGVAVGAEVGTGVGVVVVAIEVDPDALSENAKLL